MHQSIRLAALALSLIFVGSASAQTLGTGSSGTSTDSADYVQQCQDAWDLSPAADYCSATIGRLPLRKVVVPGLCTATGTCTIDIDHVTTSEEADASIAETDSRTLSNRFSARAPVASTSDLTLCFAPHPVLQRYHIAISTTCGTDETELEDAISDGLETLSSGSGNSTFGTAATSRP